jgi:hypothetical protein
MGTVTGWWAERAEMRQDRIGCEGEAETDADRGVVGRWAWQLHAWCCVRCQQYTLHWRVPPDGHHRISRIFLRPSRVRRMAKPTLLQSLLGRPSQSYAFPRERQRYSSRRELARALASSSRGEVAPPLRGVEQFQKGKGKASYARPNEEIPLPNSETASRYNSISSDSDDDSADEVFYTPFSSPPTSMLIDPPIPFIPSDPSPPDDKSSSSSASSSSSSSTSHSLLSCSTPPTSDELHAAFAALQKRPARQSRSKRLSTPSKSYTYTDEDWAKEFRWLVQPSSSVRPTNLDLVQSGFPPTIPHKPKPRLRPRTVVSRPITNHRMTALLEEDEDAIDDLRSSSPQSHLRSPFSPPLSRTNSITSNSHDVRSASHASHSRISLSSRTVELPQFPSSSSPGPAPGYTTLSLPRASYRPEDPWRSLGGGHVNLPRDGLAQTSMVSVEVVRGAASVSMVSWKRNSASPRNKKHDLAGAIALSSHRPPPSFVPNSDVLVQVHAIGLEGLDRQIVIDKLAVSDAGGKGATSFVPGRGVLGRVVECGLEVSSDTLKKGEWVIGLLDVKKVRCHRVCSPGVLLY